jgi:hypothetical protein
VLLAEAGLRSNAEGRRIELPVVTIEGADASGDDDAEASGTAAAAEASGVEAATEFAGADR